MVTVTDVSTTCKEVVFRSESNQTSFLMTTTEENVGTSLGVNKRPIKVWFTLATKSELESWRSGKSDGIGVGRIRKFPFSSDSAYDSVAYDQVKTRLSESEAEGEG